VKEKKNGNENKKEGKKKEDKTTGNACVCL
jgi:hypothetical protein